MRILYHLTILPPRMPACDAVVQEVEALRQYFGGEVLHLNPNLHLPIHLPRMAFGLHKLRTIRAREADVQIHHLLNPDPFPFPILRALRRPIVYTLTGGLPSGSIRRSFLASLAAITVADERSLDGLRAMGLDNVLLVRPGIDTARFTHSPLPLTSDIRLMVGSAPWTRSQFKTKGVNALLAAAQRLPRLRLVFLWRGVLVGEMARRVRKMGLEDRVTILNREVDVNEVLAQVHASVALASDPTIIRPYPHSLMESLAAGKPVLVSRCIPMADHVEQTGCGKTVELVDPDVILNALEALGREYEALRQAACVVGQRDFAQQAMLTSYERVYENALRGSIGP
jgi:glycosyltransferase involved in cell wall biosynthesis